MPLKLGIISLKFVVNNEKLLPRTGKYVLDRFSAWCWLSVLPEGSLKVVVEYQPCSGMVINNRLCYFVTRKHHKNRWII